MLKKNVFFCFCFVLFFSGLFSAVVRALFVCALVACMAAYATAVALALATDVTIHAICEHLEHAEPVVQVVKHGMDARDDRLSEFGKSVLEVLNEA